MTFLTTACNVLGVLAVIAAFFLVALFSRVALTRKTSLAWINILFSLVALAMGSESLSNLLSQPKHLEPADLVTKSLFYLGILICTVLSVPLYLRVRRHPGYDELDGANKQLEYSKQLFKTFLDETPFAAYVVDGQERFVYVNSRTAADHNTSSESMVGTTYDQWFPANIRERLTAQNAAVIASGQRAEYVNELPMISGKATYLSSKFPLPAAAGETLIGVVSLEISEELKSKATDSLLAKIVELSPDAIYTVSDTKEITSWNKAAEIIFGYSASEIIGKNLDLLSPPDREADVNQTISRLAAGEVIKDEEFVHIAKDGTLKHLSLSATKIKSFLGSGASYAGIARDQSDARLAANQMKALNRALDRRVAALSQVNAELPLARDQALEALKMRSAFAASMSHAIRTPLSGILGVSDLLLDKELDEENMECVHTIRDSATALLAIVNDILNISSMTFENRQIEQTAFNLATMINDCVKLLQPGAANKQVKLVTRIDPTLPQYIFGDQSRIRQIMLNLLGNAVKFTAAGEVSVEVEVLSENKKNATIKFIVADSGIGIADEDAVLLFTPFSRIEKSTRGIKGSGLGLSISKRYVDMMHGSIDFESRPGGGSKFWFSLPLKKVPQEEWHNLVESQSLKKGGSAPALAGSKILIVEDSKAVAMLTVKQLEKFGAMPKIAKSGHEALTIVRKQHFDTILMDLNLPDLSGYEVTTKIREWENAEHLNKHIIIAVTAGGMHGDRDKALKSGMDDYLTKPVKPEILKSTILRWMESRMTQ